MTLRVKLLFKMCQCHSLLSYSQNETLTKLNACLSQSSLLGCGSDVSSCGRAACTYKQFCLQSGFVIEQKACSEA